MAIATEIYHFLDLIRDALEGATGVPQRVTALATAKGVSISAPAEYVITASRRKRVNLPSCVIWIYDRIPHTQYFSSSPILDYEIPLLVTVVQNEGGLDEELADRQSFFMARCVEEAIEGLVEDLAGVWKSDVIDVWIDEGEGDKNRRIIEVQARVMARTTKEGQ